MKAIKLTFSVAFIVLSQFVFAQTGTWSLAGNNLAGIEKLGSTNNAALNFITNNKTRMSLSGAGNLKFSSDQSSIQFPIPTASSKPMIFMFPSGTSNVNRMVIAHSPAFSNWGLQYNDFIDRFDFLRDGTSVFNVDLSLKSAGVNGTFNVTGNVGIGTASIGSPSELFVLHKNGEGHGLRLQNELAHGNSWTIFETDGSGLALAWDDIIRGIFDPLSGEYFALSDLRAKKDIDPAPDVLEKVMQLQVKKYHFLQNQTSDKKHYGMIAQDVEKIFPEIVSHKLGKDQDVYAVNYSAYGVIAIKAIQEQQKKVEQLEQTNQEQQQKITALENQITEQQKIISDLKSSIDQMRQSISLSSQSSSLITKTSELSGARLIQNAPNPFRESTSINYYLPQNKNNATIEIVSANGRLIKSIPLTKKGNGQISLNSGELSAGTYFYTLKVDGVKVDSKQMIVMK